ncbi:MAG: GNAT family N-acetyltransferase [Candidatus Helarchaeota archaeon]|nr:GNAT family N-acetyltransferase [Candidatus Helarchaeota archaeon]
MKIRNAKLMDLSEIVSLWWEMQSFHSKYDSLFYDTKPEQLSKEIASKYFKISIENENHILIVIENDEKLIGMLHSEVSNRPPIYNEGKKATIIETVVTEEFRGQGLFQQMFDVLKDELKLRNIRFCTLSVDKDNIGGIRAYSKSNFKERHKMMICKL